MKVPSRSELNFPSYPSHIHRRTPQYRRFAKKTIFIISRILFKNVPGSFVFVFPPHPTVRFVSSLKTLNKKTFFELNITNLAVICNTSVTHHFKPSGNHKRDQAFRSGSKLSSFACVCGLFCWVLLLHCSVEFCRSTGRTFRRRDDTSSSDVGTSTCSAAALDWNRQWELARPTLV